jgi:hypothetical protein
MAKNLKVNFEADVGSGYGVDSMSKKTVRDQDRKWLFSAVRLPGILESDEAAVLLGVPPHTIPILIAAKHLKPLGKPREKSSKKFSTDYIDDLSHDQKWQDHAVRIIETYWTTQNSKKSGNFQPP